MYRIKSALVALFLVIAGWQFSMANAQEATRLSITQTGAGHVLQVPVSKLEMIIPAQGFAPLPTGSNNNGPRYFSFSDTSRKLVLSGWFEHESGFKGLREFWSSEQVAWDRNGLAKPTDVVFGSTGDWQFVFYRQPLPIPAGGNTHVRAHVVKAGTWIDLHISASNEDSAAAQRELIQEVLKTIVVREKG